MIFPLLHEQLNTLPPKHYHFECNSIVKHSPLFNNYIKYFSITKNHCLLSVLRNWLDETKLKNEVQGNGNKKLKNSIITNKLISKWIKPIVPGTRKDIQKMQTKKLTRANLQSTPMMAGVAHSNTSIFPFSIQYVTLTSGLTTISTTKSTLV